MLQELDAQSGLDKVVFVLSSEETELRERVSGMIVHSFESEEALLRAWLKWFIEADPDAIVLFEVILSALDCRSMFARAVVLLAWPGSHTTNIKHAESALQIRRLSASRHLGHACWPWMGQVCMPCRQYVRG